jgi:hypothetical protein
VDTHHLFCCLSFIILIYSLDLLHHPYYLPTHFVSASRQTHYLYLGEYTIVRDLEYMGKVTAIAKEENWYYAALSDVNSSISGERGVMMQSKRLGCLQGDEVTSCLRGYPQRTLRFQVRNQQWAWFLGHLCF